MPELYVMSPLEIAWGYLVGHVDAEMPGGSLTEIKSSREMLEGVIRRALLRQPCGVAFSGGRDSSLVLAVATHVARRDGLAEPVPITRLFPGVAEADEQEWQEAVVRHLGLRDWERLVLDDELDVVGPRAQTHLLAHGVVWPPSITSDLPMIDAVPGGSMMDGEGGDEVLGVRAHRIASLTRLARSPRPFRISRFRSALGTVAPAAVRGRHHRRKLNEHPFTWLRPRAWDALLSELERLERDQPISFASSVRMVPRRRAQVIAARNVSLFAARRDVEFSSPLLDPGFVAALAREGGLFGPVDRTTALRALASDLLPDAVLARTSKATFTRCYMAQHTRAFASSWTGKGLDTDLVDTDELRRVWISESPAAQTSALLQAAWIAHQTESESARL